MFYNFKNFMTEKINKFTWIESKRLSIKDKVNEATLWYRKILDWLAIWKDLPENEKTIKLLEYVLSEIYFDKSKRESIFQDLLSKDNLTSREISEFLELDSNVLISWDDWKKLILTWISNWSYWEAWNNIEDRINMISTISYYSLQATLRTWIHTWLFIQNIGKFFPHLKDDIFKEFKKNPDLSWWLALTELTSWSDLINDFDTTYKQNEDWTYTIEWTKHLQWLTNEATHWIVLAKEKKWRKFRLFLIDTRDENQNVDMIEEYDMRWLESITYWINNISATVPKENMSELLDKDATWSRTLTSMLYDSRLQFPCMITWAMQRIYDESIYKSKLTKISSKWNMIENPIVISQLFEIKTRTSIVDLINKYLIYKEINLFENNSHNSDLSIIAKTISTDYILKAWEVAKNLQWWFWFKDSNIISNMIDDAWPFSRFEWVNEMLYSQLAVSFEKNNLDLLTSIDTIANINSLEDINNLWLNNFIKWQIYSRLHLISMINEMWLQNTHNDETLFLIKEINSFIINNSVVDLKN